MANLFRMQSKCANTAGRPAACLHAWLLPFPIVQLFIMKWIVACMACHTGKYSSNRHIVDTEMKKKQLQRQWGTKCGRRLQKKRYPKKACSHARIIYIIHHQQKHGKVFIPSYKLNDTHTHTSKQASRQAGSDTSCVTQHCNNNDKKECEKK